VEKIMDENEITQLLQTQAGLLEQLTGAVNTMSTRLAPALQPGPQPELFPPASDPADSPVSAMLKQHNFQIAAAHVYLADLLARLEL
jgi:hypothetical protein